MDIQSDKESQPRKEFSASSFCHTKTSPPYTSTHSSWSLIENNESINTWYQYCCCYWSPCISNGDLEKCYLSCGWICPLTISFALVIQYSEGTWAPGTPQVYQEDALCSPIKGGVCSLSNHYLCQIWLCWLSSKNVTVSPILCDGCRRE